MLTLPATLCKQIQAHARETYPNECCGILLAENPVLHDRILIRRAIRAANSAAPDLQAKNYLIDPRDILRADKLAQSENLEIAGWYHSHPDHPALPSQTDLAQAWPDYIYIIAPVTAQSLGPLRAWRLTEPNKLTELPIRSK